MNKKKKKKTEINKVFERDVWSRVEMFVNGGCNKDMLKIYANTLREVAKKVVHMKLPG